MNGSERTNEAAENPAEKKGDQKDTDAPDKSRNETVSRQKGGQSNERIELEKNVTGWSSLISLSAENDRE